MNFISNYEKQYMSILKDIYENGYEDGVNERTGKSTKRLPGKIIQVDVEKELPVLKSKFVASRTALKEILWIWQKQSNNIKDLDAHIWDAWADKDGSIGKAYGYQIAQGMEFYTDTLHKSEETHRFYNNQAEYVLKYLKEIPNGRQCVVTLWNKDQIKDMNLVPCCHTTTWNLDGGRLNLVLDQRSGDFPYGVPFNTTQYAELMILFARDLGVKPGILTHVIADAHIYDNQMDGVSLQLKYYDLMCSIGNRSQNTIQMKAHNIINNYDTIFNTYLELIEQAKEALNCKPFFEVDCVSNNFFEATPDCCMTKDYNNMGKIDFGEVAV